MSPQLVFREIAVKGVGIVSACVRVCMHVHVCMCGWLCLHDPLLIESHESRLFCFRSDAFLLLYNRYAVKDATGECRQT